MYYKTKIKINENSKFHGGFAIRMRANVSKEERGVTCAITDSFLLEHLQYDGLAMQGSCLSKIQGT